MLKKLILVIVLAALGWSAFWYWQAQALRSEIDRAVAQARAEGWQIAYEDLGIRGFPNRLDVTLQAVDVTSPDGGLRWQAPFFQVFQLTYKPGHVIAVWPDAHAVTVDGIRYAVDGAGQRASLVFTAAGRILRANAEAQSLTVAPEDASPVTLDQPRAALEVLEGDELAYRLAAGAASLGTTGQETPATDLRLDLTAHLDAPLRIDQRRPPRPNRFEIRTIRQTLDPMTVQINGDVDVDGSGRLDGALDLRAEDWRAYLDAQGADGGGPEEAVRGLLEMVSLVSGGGETLDLTLRLEDGQMSVGLIPLGPAPRLRLP